MNIQNTSSKNSNKKKPRLLVGFGVSCFYMEPNGPSWSALVTIF